MARFRRSNFSAARYKSKPAGWLQARAFKRNPQLQMQQAAARAKAAMVDAAARAIQNRIRAISKGRKVRQWGRSSVDGGLLMGGRYRKPPTAAQFKYK